MKFLLHKDTSLNFSLQFRGAAQIMHSINDLPLNLITDMVVVKIFLIWKVLKILIELFQNVHISI
jgi:hypothetical protein